MTRARLLAVFVAVIAGTSGCLTGDERFERGWGAPLAVLGDNVGNSWGVFAESQFQAADVALAVMELDGDGLSGRVLQGETDANGVTTVQVSTSSGTWAAAVDAEGQVVWSDPLPEDPWELAGVLGDAGMAVENLAATCETCTSGLIGWIIVGVVVVAAVAVGAYMYGQQNAPSRNPARQASPQRETDPRANPGSGGSSSPAGADCGPEPESDPQVLKKNAAARRARFAWLQCMARANAR